MLGFSDFTIRRPTTSKWSFVPVAIVVVVVPEHECMMIFSVVVVVRSVSSMRPAISVIVSIVVAMAEAGRLVAEISIVIVVTTPALVGSVVSIGRTGT